MVVQARPKYVGGAVKRREDPRLLTGRGRYVADIQLPRMLHMAVVRSPEAHARITAIDAAPPWQCWYWTCASLPGPF